MFYATAKPDSLALDKEPVEEEDQVEEEEEDKVMLEKFHLEFRGNLNCKFFKLLIFQTEPGVFFESYENT